MHACPACGADWPNDASACPRCGFDPAVHGDGESDDRHAPDPHREWFERRMGIDIGDRSVAEFVEALERRDFSLTVWVWLVVAAELASITLAAIALFGPGGWGLLPGLVAISGLMAFAILADTRAVGQFRQWSKTRWTYVGLSTVPLCGQIAGLLYLVLRRLMHLETEEQRRRLLDAGVDVDAE